ncbi:Uncharacterized conserved protein [Janthinobacterium sp. Marseille]|nr:hypothetical protein [Janthinobacterium sp. Marseille]ABR91257.1 Uncharacterized conserved protein [Janthinobacterium sp. Marseille]
MKPALRSFFNIALLGAAFTLSACSPKFDWREIRSNDAPYAVAMPSKPTTLTRQIDLNGTQVAMTMTASSVDGITFAVGSAELPDATLAQVSLSAMKTALVNNIGGTIKQEKTLTMAQGSAGGQLAVMEMQALGAASNEPARVLFARFVAQDKRVYQLVVTGSEKVVKRELVDTFFSSFKLN